MALYCYFDPSSSGSGGAFGPETGLVCVEIPDEVVIPPEEPIEGEDDPDGEIVLPDGTVVDATGLTAPLTGLKQIVWQPQPFQCLWGERSDGQLVGMTYDKLQDVWGWHRHPMSNGAVFSSCVIPSATSEQHELWAVVRRMVGGQTRHFIERMSPRIEPADLTDKARFNFLDCSVAYSGAPATVFTGLDHLEGETVRVWADGVDAGEFEVGAVTGGLGFVLPTAASVVKAGLHTDAILVSLPTARLATERQTVVKVTVRFAKTLYGEAGRANEFEKLHFRSTASAMDASPNLWDGDMEVTLGGGHDDLGVFSIRQATPGPMTILAAFPTYKSAP